MLIRVIQENSEAIVEFGVLKGFAIASFINPNGAIKRAEATSPI